MDRKFSEDPAVHRDLVVQDPPQEGRDVANLQRAIKERLKDRGLADDVPTPVHGKFTHATAVACVEAGYFLGLRSETYLAKSLINKRPALRCTEGAQTIARFPDKRDGDQLARAKVRRAQLERGPRYYDDLAKESIGAPAGNMEAALAWAMKQVGIHESPAGSNWGHPVQDWAKLAGYISAVPWCGAYVNAVVMQGGIPSGAGWIGYTPAIIQHAKAGTGGWKWVGPSGGQRGMVPVFDTPGGDPAVHTGICLERLSPTLYKTVEGNTSTADGSQSDGGIVAVRHRVTSGSFYIVGFAVPPWKS